MYNGQSSSSSSYLKLKILFLILKCYYRRILYIYNIVLWANTRGHVLIDHCGIYYDAECAARRKGVLLGSISVAAPFRLAPFPRFACVCVCDGFFGPPPLVVEISRARCGETI